MITGKEDILTQKCNNNQLRHLYQIKIKAAEAKTEVTLALKYFANLFILTVNLQNFLFYPLF